MNFGNLPLQREAASNVPLSLQVLLILLLVGVVVLSWWMRRRGVGTSRFARAGARLLRPWRLAAGTDAPLEVLRAVRLTPDASLHVVRWSGEDLLLACSSGGVEVLRRRTTSTATVCTEAVESERRT